MLAWDCNGHSYSAATTRCAVAREASTSPRLTGTPLPFGFASRMYWWSFSIGGKGAHCALHVTLMASAARTASHSRSATTARKSFSRTTRAPGMPLIEFSSTDTGLQPALGGRITRACSMPSTCTSVMYCSRPITFSVMTFCGNDLPTILYSEGDLGCAAPLTSSGLPYSLFHSSW